MDTANEVYKPKECRLRGIPEDVYEIILDAQNEHKKKHKTQFSIEKTIYSIIRKTKKAGS